MKMNVVKANNTARAVLCLVILMSSLVLVASPASAVPPAKWEVGMMVYYDPSNTPFTHLLQFPGAPTGFDCSDTPSNTDWCLWMNCATTGSSTYDCETVPLAHVCLAVQVSGGVAKKITNVDSDACK